MSIRWVCGIYLVAGKKMMCVLCHEFDPESPDPACKKDKTTLIDVVPKDFRYSHKSFYDVVFFAGMFHVNKIINKKTASRRNATLVIAWEEYISKRDGREKRRLSKHHASHSRGVLTFGHFTQEQNWSKYEVTIIRGHNNPKSLTRQQQQQLL